MKGITFRKIVNSNPCIVIVVLLISSIIHAQNDTIQLQNEDILVGEIKSFSTGILIMETSYSDEDFKIEFNKVRSLVIQRKCIIILTEGRRRFGNIKSSAPGMVVITLEDGTAEHFKLEEVITLQEVDDNFWKRFNGSIDLGYNFTKANNNAQFTIAGQFGYIGEKWLLQANINVLSSKQDDTDKIKRNDASVELLRLLPNKWYLVGDVSFLSNTEQALDARISPTLGAGKLLISTRKLYLGLSVGFTYNIENYVDESLDKTSSEAYISSSFNMFDFNDFDLNTGIKFYPSLSEKGRIRTDYDLTLKYDLPLDFYVKLGFTLNFDNQPAIEGNKFDYIFTSGFGWEFD